MVKNIKNEVNSSKENQQFIISTVGTKDNTKKGEMTMSIKEYTSYEVNLLRINNKFTRNKTSTFTQKPEEERKIEILKLEVKKRLKADHIIFTETPFGILIDMTFRRQIVFSKDPVGYKIYTESGFELGCSNDRFMTKDDVFEALNWTILEINLDLHGNLPFNVYATNDREVA